MAKIQSPATTAPIAFDVDDFEDVQSSPVAIKHPLTGAVTTLVIELAGPEHPARKRVQFERARRMRAGLMRTGKMQLGDPENDVEDQTDDLVAFTLGWSGLQAGGQAVAYSIDAARRLYTDPKRSWLREQVIAALQERDAFISRSAQS